MSAMFGNDVFLAVYDAQLRTRAETIDAELVRRIGPLHCAVFSTKQGVVTYSRPTLRNAASILRLIPAALSFFEESGVATIVWKTRGHDLVPGLELALRKNRFHPKNARAVMMGLTESLTEAPDVPGVHIERVTGEDDILRALATSDRLGGRASSQARGNLFLEAISHSHSRGVPEPQLWIARLKDRIVSSGRLEPIPGTQCAGLKDGVTDPKFRGLGIHRALTAARARAALAFGTSYLYSESTPRSQRFQEGLGLIAVTSTTLFVKTVNPSSSGTSRVRGRCAHTLGPPLRVESGGAKVRIQVGGSGGFVFESDRRHIGEDKTLRPSPICC